ncbi:MAG: glutamate--tRNA ligase [Candidatus Moranbacteria bacterium]|nr:glutamate--tRNA ligase [Candidatus Moranbacteria bacterium]
MVENKKIEEKETNKARTRFAPSPTGMVHVGNLRTALFAWLLAASKEGDFLVRIEDTDQKRFQEEATKKILESLNWLGIEIDEGVYLDKNGSVQQKGGWGPYIQSQRLGFYKEYADKLVAEGKAYYCFCSSERLEEARKRQQAQKQPPMYDGACREMPAEEARQRMEKGEKCVIRLKVPKNEKIEFKDEVFGEVSVNSNTVDDQVLIKSDGFPTYHLAVVVDDYLMGITHVVRGEDWIPSAPKHVLLYKFLGWPLPKFVHLPNVLGQDKKKLSKRQGDVSVEEFQEKGYLPEAMMNFLALLGWNPKNNQEIMSKKDLLELFNEKGFHKAGAIFDYKKLDWINGYYIRQKTDDEAYEMCKPYLDDYLQKKGFQAGEEKLKKIVFVEKERMKKLSDITENIHFYFIEPAYEQNLLRWKEMTDEQVKSALLKMKQTLESINDFEDLEEIKEKITEACGEQKGEHLWPLRVALSGEQKSPGPFEIAWIIGREESLKRVDRALKKI